MSTRVLFIRLPEHLHKEMQTLAARESTTLQKLGMAAVKNLLDMAYQHGRFEDADGNICKGSSQEETQNVQAHCDEDIQ